MNFFQHLVYIVARIMLIVYLVKTDDRLTNVRENTPHIIVVNHISKLDAFIAIGAMRPRNYLKLRLFRFMTHNRYLSGFHGYLLRLTGAYPAKQTVNEEYGLEASRSYLELNESVVIFPEGRIVKPGAEYKIHSGVAVLAQEPRVRIIPIHLSVKNKEKPNKVFNNLTIIIGEPFSGKHLNPKQIMDKVYEL